MTTQTTRPFIPRLGAFPAFDAKDPDLVADAIRNNFHQADVDIPETKYFRTCYNYVDLGGLSLHFAHITSGFYIKSEATAADLVFLRLFRGDMCLASGKERFTINAGQRAALLDFNHRTQIYQEKGYDTLTMRFVRRRVEDILGSLTGVRCSAPLAFAPSVDLTTPDARRMLNVLDHVVDLFSHDSGILSAPLIVAQCEALLITTLLACLEHNYSHLLRKEAAPAPPRVVRLVESYLEANVDKPLRLADLVPLTGLSVRSIQAAFQKSRGYSPSDFLRECRLAKARWMLKQAPPNASVMSVALECGFASHSAFSRLYRQRYGESPSETLRDDA